MDVSEMITMLDQHGFEDEEEADKIRVLNIALQDVCTRYPWPFLESSVVLDASIEVDSDTGLVSTPDDFASLMTIVSTDSNGHEIRFIRRDEHLKRHASTLTEGGSPYNYFFLGGQMYLWPIPISGSYVLDYIRIQDAIEADSVSDDILLPSRHHDVIPIGAIWRLHAKEDDAENALLFKSQYDELINGMRQDLFKQQWDSPDSIQVMEDDIDDWMV
jgi:hypothetical protein